MQQLILLISTLISLFVPDVNTQSDVANQPVVHTESEFSVIFGYWFTPHAALRNITFNPDGTFVFEYWSSADQARGTYQLQNNSVTLNFDSQDLLNLELQYVQDDYAQYLVNDAGEYFVKQ